MSGEIVEELAEALADALQEVVGEVHRVVDDVARHLLDLRDHRPEGGRGNAEQFQQPLDDELDGIVDEAFDGVHDAPDEAARLLAQFSDLGAHLVHCLRRALAQILVECVAGLVDFLPQLVELGVEAGLFLGRPLLERGGQGVEDDRDLVARLLDARLARLDDRVDFGRDFAQFLDDAVGEVLLRPVIALGRPVGQAGEIVRDRGERAFMALLDLIGDALEVRFESSGEVGLRRLPLVHGVGNKVFEKALHILLGAGEGGAGLRPRLFAHLRFGADHRGLALHRLFENAARIFTLIETIVNGLADIIAGNVAGFANAVEKGLAMLVAPVLGFIADYLGFGDLPKAVAKQIKSFQKWILGIIEKAFDWLIEKGKALLAALGIGGKKDKDKKDDDKKDFDGKIGEVAHWAGPHENHEMWIAETTGGVEVMMASGQKGPVRAKLTKYENKAINLSKGPGSKEDIEDRQKRASDAIKSARQKLDATEQAAKATKATKATKAAIAKNDAKPDDVKAKDQQTEDWQEKLWPELQIIEIAIDDIPMPETKIHGGSGQATTVTARPLSKDGSSGSKPRGKLRGWPLVAGRNPQWVAAHLLSEKLHGPGDPWNTTPMRTGDNTRMPIRFAMAMDEERDLRGAFTDLGTFTARMTAFYKTKGGNPDDKLSEGVAAVLLLITEKKAKWPK
ncbi:hypothetical protein HH800_16600 [Sphingobium yanoikuyae]|uniref:Uncharacterized protein n=1 Tax=Sphingobium yanoikuyae TaxID=13690 RepID=A0A6M4G936_SPHYA|nr:hypothetical protein [Sphingobium yanoikuyae]QJR03659.1 hypothetical protein HH800_16600 [Sphingobium yanoikuyae]